MDHCRLLAPDIFRMEDERNDQINKLPDSVLSYMLSFLPIKDAVRTSVICHRWRHLWRHPILTRNNVELDIINVFGGSFTQLLEEYGEKIVLLISQFERQVFEIFVNEYLVLYSGKKVDSLKVHFFLGAESTAIVDSCAQFAIKRGVEVLDLRLLNPNFGHSDAENVYVFPHWLLPDSKAPTIKHLSLQRCVLKPPRDFDSFIQLTAISLNNCIVDPVFTAHLFPACLLLESVTLRDCRVGSNLTIGPSLRLKHLKVLQCLSLSRIVIDAVNLSSLEYDGDHWKISCKRAPQLVRYYFWGGSEGALPYALQLASSCPVLETLYLQFYDNLEVIPQTISTSRNLKQVTLYLRVPTFDLWSVVNLLKAAPLVEEFIIMAQETEYYGDISIESGFSHEHLRKCKMLGFQGSRMEIEFAIWILKIAIKLEELVIDPCGKYYAGDGKWGELSCQYEEGNEVDEEVLEDKMILDNMVSGPELDYALWKLRAVPVVRERLKESMTSAQVIIL